MGKMGENLGEKLKRFRKESGLSMVEVERRLRENGYDISGKTVYGYESGLRMPNADVFVVLCNIYGIGNFSDNFRDTTFPGDALTDAEWSMVEKYRFIDDHGKKVVDFLLSEEFTRCQEPQPRKHLYTYYHRIACAGDGFLFDDIPPEIIEAPECPGADFIIGVNGDSMEPTLSDGDLVYVRRTDTIKIGAIGIFTIRNECYVKELGETGLVSHNPDYPEIPGDETVRCIGEVIGKVEGEGK